MAIVTPCRSDQSTLGLAPFGHLADGRIQLVLVHKCSRLQYLRFLAAIPQAGKLHGCHLTHATHMATACTHMPLTGICASDAFAVG